MKYIDSHLHGVNFLQQSTGIKKLLEKMDKSNIEKSVLMGIPIMKKWDSYDEIEPIGCLDNDSKCYYYSYTDQIIADMFASLCDKEKKRFAPLICGFNPTDMHGIKHVEYLLEHNPIWRGVGEVFLRHNSLTNITNEETARADHPSMGKIYQLCNDRNLPIIIHQDSTAIERSNIYAYTGELNNVLKKFPKLKIIWAHGGVTEYIKYNNYYKLIHSMLCQYNNLYIDLSWVIFEQIIYKHHTISKYWIKIIENFPYKFIIGSDVTGDFNNLPRIIKRYDKLLNKLSPKTKKLVAYANADKLFFS
ncbi:MAG: amidohydrolase family protein [Patescibacteria group bacterium]|jgi:hypothetical protein